MKKKRSSSLAKGASVSGSGRSFFRMDPNVQEEASKEEEEEDNKRKGDI